MEIILKKGIDKLLFGMKQNNVEKIYGKPNLQFKDEDNNIIYLYNEQKIRLTFYEDEDFKLGYIIASNPNLTLFENKIIHQQWNNINDLLASKNIKSIEKETFDSVINYFNESNWMIFQTEFDEVIRFELGVVFNPDSDDFDWKF